MPNEEDEDLNIYKDRYKLLFETAQDGILLINLKDGMVYDVNKFFLDMLDLKREEIVGKELWELGFFKDINIAKETFETLQKDGYVRYEDLPLRTKEGEEMDTEFVCNSYPIGPESDSGKTIQCNVRDITVRKTAERKLDKYIEEIEKLNKLMVGRELKMIDLKEVIEKLKRELVDIKDELRLNKLR